MFNEFAFAVSDKYCKNELVSRVSLIYVLFSLSFVTSKGVLVTVFCVHPNERIVIITIKCKKYFKLINVFNLVIFMLF